MQYSAVVFISMIIVFARITIIINVNININIIVRYYMMNIR